jgi:hypothetical protein
MTPAEPLAMTSAMPKPKRSRPDKKENPAMSMPAPLPPNNQPPAWFMPQWLDNHAWFWDPKRVRHVIVLRNHVVQIVGHKKLWRWRVERMTGFGTSVVSVSGCGFLSATEARRDVLAVFWSDLWTGRAAHEHWRYIHAQKPLVRRPEVIASRSQWAAEVETAVRTGQSA